MSAIKFLEDNELIIGDTEWTYVPFRFNKNLKIGGYEPTWQDVVLSGIGSLTLVNAKANGLNYVKLYGGCERDYTTESMDYATVDAMAHSTYDSSKFTVVGSPTITSDGIASNFNSSNYIYKDLLFVNQQKWMFEIECTYNGLPSGTIDVVRMLSTTTEDGWVILRQVTGGKFAFSVYDGTNNATMEFTPTSVNIGDKLKFICRQESYSLRTLDVYVNGIKSGNTVTSTVTVDTSTSVFQAKNRISIGGNIHRTYGYTGSIDLKQFAVFVDDEPIFSGNQTDDYLVKADNYTVVGTPTITDKGVVSGFSNSSYISYPVIQLGTYNSWTVITPAFTTGNEINAAQFIYKLTVATGTSPGGIKVYITAGKLNVQCGSSTTSSTDILKLNTFVVAANTTYKVKISFTGTEYIAWYSINNGGWTEYGRASKTTTLYNQLNSANIGYDSSISPSYFSGSVDLTTFKIYVNNNLVYQPYIKIPYTLTSNNSWVVDSYYSSSVLELTKNPPFFPVIVLDNTNQTATQYVSVIKCNNGVIKVRNKSGLPLGYTRVAHIGSTGTQWIDTGINGTQITRFVVKGTCAQTINGNNSQLLGGTGNSAFTFFGCRIINGEPFWYCRDASASLGDPSHLSIIDCTINSTTSQTGTLKDLITGTTENFISMATSDWGFPNENLLLFGGDANRRSTDATCYELQLYTLSGLVRDFIPCKRNSDSVYGIYDTVNNVFYTNQGTGTFTYGANDDSLEVYADGTVEVVTDSLGNTANAERLLAVGDYKDTQEVLSGNVTRNIGIKVLDGTEEWADNGSGVCYIVEQTIQNNVDFASVCSHYVGVAPSSGMSAGDYVIRCGSSSSETWAKRIAIKDKDHTTYSSLKSYLADQYNAGTPVIVVYPLATPTTETVTAQPMNIQEGTNIVQITQASIDDLELEVKYKAGVTVTITEVENANLDNQVEVIING